MGKEKLNFLVIKNNSKSINKAYKADINKVKDLIIKMIKDIK